MITKEKFHAYVEVQMGGATNMFDVKNVQYLSKVPLSKDEIIDIMENYSKYKEMYGYPELD